MNTSPYLTRPMDNAHLSMGEPKEKEGKKETKHNGSRRDAFSLQTNKNSNNNITYSAKTNFRSSRVEMQGKGDSHDHELTSDIVLEFFISK